jgi:formylglycine-generating enzyme required for sulfatase activity
MGTNPSHFKGPIRPAEKVSWDDCQAFCTKLTAHLSGTATVRLPTEAEWEYACRAGTTTHYHFGDVPSVDKANYTGSVTWNGSKKGKKRKQTTDVGEFPPNPWGVFDLHGNVWEWCADCYAPYAGDDQTNPRGSDSITRPRMVRGGSWGLSPENCRVASRGWRISLYRDRTIGFRVCFRLG